VALCAALGLAPGPARELLLRGAARGADERGAARETGLRAQVRAQEAGALARREPRVEVPCEGLEHAQSARPAAARPGPEAAEGLEVEEGDAPAGIDQQIRVFEVAMVEAVRVQPADRISERPQERAPLRASVHESRQRDRQRIGSFDEAAQEEALAHDAEATPLGDGQHLRLEQVRRREPSRRRECAPRARSVQAVRERTAPASPRIPLHGQIEGSRLAGDPRP
jgi:hypothetical protein